MSVWFVPVEDTTVPHQVPAYALDEDAIRGALWYFGRRVACAVAGSSRRCWRQCRKQIRRTSLAVQYRVPR